jgi:nucleoside 2-deoxyribosyltransferase
MLKVYLAAPYQKKEDIRNYAKELRSLGIEVTSRWIDEPDKPNVQLKDVDAAMLRLYAGHDVADVQAADVFVLFTDPTKTIIRQGRTVESGLAIAFGMPIVAVGLEFENIFHYLPQFTHFETWYDVRDKLYAMYVQATQ